MRGQTEVPLISVPNSWGQFRLSPHLLTIPSFVLSEAKDLCNLPGTAPARVGRTLLSAAVAVEVVLRENSGSALIVNVRGTTWLTGWVRSRQIRPSDESDARLDYPIDLREAVAIRGAVTRWPATPGRRTWDRQSLR